MRAVILGLFLPLAAAHSSLIRPKPRNAIDSELPEWKGGKAPYVWQPNGNVPCACRNGTEACESAQTCLWMSVGCSIGCKECDGGSAGGANPNGKDRCNSGMNATIDPKYRTLNRAVPAGSAEDWTRFNPWRSPGNAPVFDPCGRAGGASLLSFYGKHHGGRSSFGACRTRKVLGGGAACVLVGPSAPYGSRRKQDLGAPRSLPVRRVQRTM